jgi:alpha-L-rhamnosidase
VAGLGFHEVEINGRRVGDHVFDPALTNYDQRVWYLAHDVAAHLEPGENAIGVTLGNGRFFPPRWLPPEMPQPRGPNPENWFEEYITRDYGYPKLLLQLEIEYADGGRDVLVSDERWLVTADGPIRANNEYDGEEYDARLEQPGWSAAGFTADGWLPAERVAAPAGVLEAQALEPIRIVDVLPSTAIEHPDPARWIVDVGQVIYGRPRIRVQGPRGARVTIRGASARTPDGRLRTEINRAAQATDVYTLAGRGQEAWSPAFRGQGFRWLEVSADRGVELDAAEADVLSTDCTPVGVFTCSDPLLVRLWRNLWHSHRTFRRSLPMDAERDERQGWMGDHQKHAESDSYHFDVAALYRKWLVDIIGEQRPNGQLPEMAPSYWAAYEVDLVWPSLVPILAEWLYDCYADLPIVQRLYEPLVRWMAFGDTLRRPDGTWDCNNGDWCDTSTAGYDEQRPTGATSRPLIATAYQANNFRIMARFAGLLRDEARSREFAGRFEDARATFEQAFFDRDRAVYGTGTQTSQVLPLAFGLVPEDARARVAANLVEDIVERHGGHLSVGLLGVQWLMQTLDGTGHPDVAHLIATQTTFPSWGYMIERGATSTWERWDSDAQGSNMNSPAMPVLEGNLGAWFFQALAGLALDPAEPGWRRVIMRPRPAVGLRSASATRDSMTGRIESRWQAGDGRFMWRVAVPPNVVATAWVPTSDPVTVTEGGRPVASVPGLAVLGPREGALVVTLASGVFEFAAELADRAIRVAEAAV